MSRSAVKFRIEVFPRAQHGHRYRVAQVKTGKTLNVTEGYPTFQHAERHVASLWSGMCHQVTEAIGLFTWEMPPIPWHRDTHKPKQRLA